MVPPTSERASRTSPLFATRGLSLVLVGRRRASLNWAVGEILESGDHAAGIAGGLGTETTRNEATTAARAELSELHVNH